MTPDPSLGRRVARLENDTESIYELITEIRSVQEEHTRRFDRMGSRLDQIDGRLDQIDGRFDGMERRFDGMERRFDRMASTLAEVVRRLPEP